MDLEGAFVVDGDDDAGVCARDVGVFVPIGAGAFRRGAEGFLAVEGFEQCARAVGAAVRNCCLSDQVNSRSVSHHFQFFA